MNMSGWFVKIKHTIHSFKAWVWFPFQLVFTWMGFMAMGSICPFCGQPGCASGAGIYATIIAPVFTFFSWRARKKHGRREDTDCTESNANDTGDKSERYIESCRKEFWQRIFGHEIEYLVEHLKGCRDVLSVGCGPAIIEGELAKRDFNVTGLDVSREALNCAPDKVRTVVARAEDMPLPDSTFDAVIFVASLQFVENIRKTLERSASVLRPGGNIIVMLLNTKSLFFREELSDADSYVREIRHADCHGIEAMVADDFHIRTEYFLGVRQGELFESRDPEYAALYIINGIKRAADLNGEKK